MVGCVGSWGFGRCWFGGTGGSIGRAVGGGDWWTAGRDAKWFAGDRCSNHRWRILLASTSGPISVDVSAHLDTVNARLTCAGSSPTQIRRFELHTLTTT